MLRMARLFRSRFLLAPLLAILLLLLLAPLSGAQARTLPPFMTMNLGNHYLALGDSLAFGYQPDNDFLNGYTDDFAFSQALRGEGFTQYINMACPGETTSTMISGKCSHEAFRKYPYTGSQLTAALNYIKNWGPVSVVTLSIGANDLLPKIDPATCNVDIVGFQQQLATLDRNLTTVILPQLSQALAGSHGRILLTNAYNPFQNRCPLSTAYITIFNQHLAHDIQGFGTLVDVFSAFGGFVTPNSQICTLTWMCSSYADIHPTTIGYQRISNALSAVYRQK